MSENENLEQNDLEEKKQEPNKKTKISKRRMIIQIVGIGVFLIGCIVATIYIWPFFSSMDTTAQTEFRNQIQQKGILSYLIMIGIFVAQAILAVIPSMPVEVASGLMFGPWMGILICLIGSTVGSLIVIWLVKLLGRGFVDTMINYDKINKLPFFTDSNRIGIVMFFIFIMPGLPKDFTAFLVPFTNMKTRNYLIINFLGRIPSTVMTVLLGDSIFSGDFSLTWILIAVEGVIAIVGIALNKQIARLISKISGKKSTSITE